MQDYVGLQFLWSLQNCKDEVFVILELTEPSKDAHDSQDYDPITLLGGL